MKILDVLINNKLIASRSEGRRLLLTNIIKVNDKIIDDENYFINLPCDIKIGEKKHITIQ